MSVERWVYGTALHPEDVRYVLRAYVYRMTVEAQRDNPRATAQMLVGGYRMPDRTDAEWLAATRFRVRSDCRLDKRANHCETSWPGEAGGHREFTPC